MTRKNFLLKQSEMEQKQTELLQYQQNLSFMKKEKGNLNEFKNNFQSPFGDDVKDQSNELEQKQVKF